MKIFKVRALCWLSALILQFISIATVQAGVWDAFLKSPHSFTAKFNPIKFEEPENGRDAPLPVPGSNQLSAPALRFDPRDGSIHVFARCLNEQGEAALCHWQGPPGNSLWGASYWFHEIPMRVDSAPSVTYNKGANLVGVVAYANDGGEGSVHGTSCDLSKFGNAPADFDCYPEVALQAGHAHYTPVVSSAGFTPGTPPVGSFKVGLNRDGHLASIQSLLDGIRDATAEEVELRRPSANPGASCEGGEIELSPTFLMTRDPLVNGASDKPEYFAIAHGNRILHAWFNYHAGREDPWYCRIHELGFVTQGYTNAGITSAPKALIGPTEYQEIFALGPDYRPYHWWLRGPYLFSEKIADVEATMNIANYLGVVFTPEDQSEHVFFKKLGSGTVLHAYKKTGGSWTIGNPEGVTSMPVLDAPVAVADERGNIHLFVGEWNGPNAGRAGSARAYLHHFVKPVNSPNWVGETLTAGALEHTDRGLSAPAAIYISPDGDTTERNAAPPGSFTYGE